MRGFAAFLLLAAASSAWGQDVVLEIRGDVETIKVTRLVPITEDREIVKKLPFDVLGPKDADGYWWTLPPGVVANDRGDTLEITSAPNGELVVKIKVQTISFDIDFDKKTIKKKTAFTFGSRTLNIGTIPVPPPVPPTPPLPPVPPVPPTPPPQPVSSFRVILVYESGDTMTGAQKAVVYGKVVEDFLNANCTGGKNGWRRRDKDMPGENDPSMAAVWNAIKSEFAPPKNTKTPAVAVQVNDKIEIVPVEATPAAMVTVLKKYSEGR